MSVSGLAGQQILRADRPAGGIVFRLWHVPSDRWVINSNVGSRGMRQWSARGMAISGWDHMRILKTMYPGSAVQTLY